MKKMYLFIVTLATLSLSTLFVACEKDAEIDLTTISVSKEQFTPSYTSATIQCSFTTKATLRNVYVQYATTSEFAEYDEVEMQMKDDLYSVVLDELQDNTTYYIRYMVSNRYSSAMTKEISEFKTCQPSLPTIKIASISDIWDTHAKTQITLDSDGGVPVIEMGICWDIQPAPLLEKNKLATKDTSAILDITSLQPNTKYYLRAYAKNKIGVAYSEETTLTTCSLPEVKTDEITDVQVTTALLNGLLVFNGNDTSTIKGFCWGDNPLPTINNNQKQVTTSGNNFAYHVSDLKDETKYYVRAYAKNKIGIVYGEEKFFTTKKKALGFDGNPNTRGFYTPSEAIAAVDAGMIAKDDSIKVGGIISRWFPKSTGFDKYRSVTFFVMDPITGQEHEFEFYNCYSLDKDYFATFEYTDEMNAICVDVDGREFHLGDTVVGAGKYTIYNDTHELNTNCYLIDWRPVSTTGQRYLPTVTTSSATNISYTSASVGGNVTNNGGTTVTERGVVYSTNQNPTTSNSKKVSGSGIGPYSVSLTGLLDGTTYYVRAYAINKKGTAYGEQTSFATKAYALPTVTTSSATNISYTSAIVGGNVTSDGGATVTERGVVYSTSQSPTISNTKVKSGTGIGSYTCNLSNLQAETTYYVRAYATNSKGTSYGSQISFTTKTSLIGTENGLSYVDLGLSVKWATCNVGASKPEDYGHYFAWGEITTTKSTYDKSTYKWFGGMYYGLTKYNDVSSYGTVDNKFVLDKEDDAAAFYWRGNWRMPTDEEMTELRTECTWSWTTQNGVNGYKVTSNKSGYTDMSIFLPAAGYRIGTSLYNAGSNGRYWSSSLYTGNTFKACSVAFSAYNVVWAYDYRYEGGTVRPVCR